MILLNCISIFVLNFLAKRPPVEETASFLQSLIASHGPNYLEKLFGSKARDALQPLGGVEKVAIALSESQTIEGEFYSMKMCKLHDSMFKINIIFSNESTPITLYEF